MVGISVLEFFDQLEDFELLELDEEWASDDELGVELENEVLLEAQGEIGKVIDGSKDIILLPSEFIVLDDLRLESF